MTTASTRKPGPWAYVLVTLGVLVLVVVAWATLSERRQEAAREESRQGERYFELEVQAAGADIAGDDTAMASVVLVAYGYCDADTDEQVAARQGLVNAMTRLGSATPEVDGNIVADAAEQHLCDH